MIGNSEKCPMCGHDLTAVRNVKDPHQLAAEIMPHLELVIKQYQSSAGGSSVIGEKTCPGCCYCLREPIDPKKEAEEIIECLKELGLGPKQLAEKRAKREREERERAQASTEAEAQCSLAGSASTLCCAGGHPGQKVRCCCVCPARIIVCIRNLYQKLINFFIRKISGNDVGKRG